MTLARVRPASLAIALATLAACQDTSTPLGPSANDFKIRFVDRTAAAGFSHVHRAPAFDGGTGPPPAMVGGVAAGDVDADGDIDLFVVSGSSDPNTLYVNDGTGSFTATDKTSYPNQSGPVFADIDGNGTLDLLVGGVRQMADRPLYPSVHVYSNSGSGSFTDITAAAGIAPSPDTDTYSIALGDIDGDADLDVFLSHWASLMPLPGGGFDEVQPGEYLWENAGGGVFTDVTSAYGLDGLTYTFTPNFSDIDGDGDLDLLVASDFGNSAVMELSAGTFTSTGGSVISDENGMGASVGDYDNDGDFDWFVTSIWEPDGTAEGGWGVTGNRLYENDGLGGFRDVTDQAGVREGYWGWGSCFADFDNDGNLDLFHVNGMYMDSRTEFGDFISDPSRLFMSNGDGTFSEQSSVLGIDDTGQGRGLVCFDADRDGDIDIFVANNDGAPAFYENDGGTNRWLTVSLVGPAPNTQAIGARVSILTADLVPQVREIRAGSNFVSQNPAEAHFGLAESVIVPELSVLWPDGTTTDLTNVAINQHLIVRHPAS